ncbi:MAG TPA: S16 family serine protease, partial [Acidimicrobiales bacterium]|nr:S16 family serine protease [Acidimicrobiales bacterium]
TWASLTAALHDPAPASVVHVTVHPYGSKQEHTVSVRLGEERYTKQAGQLVGGCIPVGARTTWHPYDIDGKPYGCLGLYSTVSEVDYVTTGLPFAVSLDPDGIIGPSAGLAYTLALMEELDPKDLTGGHKIAATGTMSVTGQIGDVGGVAQKTVAVRNAGASVFFVPTVELATAKAHSGRQLRIFAVSSMAQVLSDLRSLGGRVATPPRAATR